MAKTPLSESFECCFIPSEVSAILCPPCSRKIEIFSAKPNFSSLIRGGLYDASSVLAVWAKTLRGQLKKGSKSFQRYFDLHMRVSYGNYFNNAQERITRFWLAESSEWVFQKAKSARAACSCNFSFLKNSLVQIKDVRSNCFCASLLRTQIPHLTLLDVRWPALFFSETDFIYNYLHIVQKWTKNQCGKLKKFKISVHGTWNPAILPLQGTWNYGL